MTDTQITATGTRKSYRTGVLLLLTLVYGFNFIDRQIVGILAPFIQADLNLSNTQLGLLIGLAFAAFYTIMGIPLAFIADRVNRVNLLAIALAVWSGFTALTGLSQNFLHIALARIGVGVGEAGGSPPSHSMISDFYSKEERAGALGVYSLGIPLGIMAAYFFTAALMGADPNTVNWRRIFIILGLSGIALAVVVRLVIREPRRGAMELGDEVVLPKIPFGEAVSRLLSIPTWWFMALGIAFASFAAYALSGFQTKYLRLLNPSYDFRTIVIIIGIINGVFYVAGTYFGAKLVDRRARTDVRAYGTIPVLSLVLALPLAVAAFAVPDVNTHLALSALLQLCIGVYLGPSFAIAQTLAPISIRAMSTALFFFILNMIALGGGPTFAGIMIDVFGNAGNTELVATRYAMFATFASFGLAILFFLLVRVTVRKDWAEAEARNLQAATGGG